MGQVNCACNPLAEPNDPTSGCNPFGEKKPLIDGDKKLQAKLQQLSKGSMIKWEGSVNDIPSGWEVYEETREDSNTYTNTTTNESGVKDPEESVSDTTISTATQTPSVTIIKVE
mmetsp:Transcript_28394/g.25078  ORF Transcript_28394/g.25078 Transcript_28394/m.25078 type:complete len:114 (-) Transcript_28394:32-373(-)